MNRKLGMYSSIINLLGVVSFAICMLIGTNFGSYISSIFIAFGFVAMSCAYCVYCAQDKKAIGYTGMIFASMYATVILLVYFAQVTTVHLENLSEQANQILNYSNFGLFFN